MFGWLTALFSAKQTVRLTREKIGSLSSEALCLHVLDTLPDLPHGTVAQRIFSYVIDLDGQVNNGGFNQYYFNRGFACWDAERALSEIGAVDLSEIVREANNCYAKNREKLEESIWGDTMETFFESCEHTLFGKYDDEYFAKADGTLYELLAKFVRSHLDDFVSEK